MTKSSLITLLFFAGGLFLIFIFVLPAWNKIDVLKNEKESKQKQLEGLRVIAAHIDELSEKYEKAQKDLEKLSLAIPSDSQLPELLVQFENMVGKSGLIIKNIAFEEITSPEEGRQTKSVKAIKIGLSVEGSYSNFKNLLSDIEQNIRLMDVADVSFSGEESENKEGIMKFSITLKTYYLP